MNLLHRSIYTITLLAAGMALGHWGLPTPASAGRSSTSGSQNTGPTILQIQPLAELTTLHLDIADVLITRLNGRLGGVSAAMVIRGDVTISTDLGLARF